MIRSPLTGGNETRLAAAFDPAVIVDRYARAGVDVRPYFAGMKSVDLMECRESGYRFFHPESLAGEASFYGALYDENGTASDYRHWSDEFQFALDAIQPGEKVLDIGCGYGYFLAGAAAKTEAVGVDGNPHAQRRCLEKGLDARQGSIQDYAKEFTGRFDVVTAFQVLEHIYDVRSFLQASIETVRAGGRLIISVPNSVPYLRRFDKYNTWNLPPHHVGLWNLQSLKQIARYFPVEYLTHAYSETSDRWVVDAYLRARNWMNVTTEIHEHTVADKVKLLLAAPLSVPLSFADSVRAGPVTRNFIVIAFRKRKNAPRP
jgi:2-polyprenyl-3-methyl-5-hydroxy-6-metoxy-1,4-benzoquinol methylase